MGDSKWKKMQSGKNKYKKKSKSQTINSLSNY